MKLVWTHAASARKEAIWHFLADVSVKHADRVELRLETRARSLAILPLQGRPVPNTMLRKLSIPDIQLVVTYRVDEESVLILDVRSTRQRERDFLP